MKYRKVYPSEQLSNFVHCYYIWDDTKHRSGPLIIESPPSGYCALVINYGDPYHLVDGADTGKLPRIFVTGQATSLYMLKFTGLIGILGVVLQPTALNKLLRIPGLFFTDMRLNLEDLMGSDATELLDRVATAPSDKKKIECAEKFLCDRLLNHEFTCIDSAANMIREKNGMVRITDLASRFGIGRRHLEKKFLETVGIAPKKYSQISRLSHICYLLSTRKEIDWQDIIYFGGFYDQSHFIREFRTFMKRNPGIYIQDNRELVKLL